METPVEVTFRNMPVSDAVEDACLDEVAKLERFYGRITACRVVITKPHRHQRKGNAYKVDIAITVPHGTIMVNRPPHLDQKSDDVYVLVRQTFDVARRRLEDQVHRMRNRVKNHAGPPPEGRVRELYPEAGYGFLEAPDGVDVYFHRNSVLGDRFTELEVGTPVRYEPSEGLEGPQARSVRLA